MATRASDADIQQPNDDADVTERRDSLTGSARGVRGAGKSRPSSSGSHDGASSMSSFNGGRRTSIFSRMSSSMSNNGTGAGMGAGGGGLRDTFFGKSRPDPLEESAHNEFNLTVIDEEGLISKPSQEIISPQLRGCCNGVRTWSQAGWIVVGIAVVVVLATYIATLLSPTLDGYTIDPGLVLGSLQTLVLCSVVVITYHGVHVFQAHPNPIILYKCLIDMTLAMRFLLDPWLLRMGVYEADRLETCSYLSGFTQFLYFSSDCWYFALIVDLYKSLTNPFTSVEADRKKYGIAVCVVGIFSGVLVGSVQSFHGLADGNYCWTNRGDKLERNFWRLNVASWTVFYDWMIVFYLSGIAVLVYGVKRLRSGLKLTLDSRREMLRNSAISIMSFTAYWTIVFSLYAISFSARTHYEKVKRNGIDVFAMSPSKVFRSYSYALAGRGVVDYFVWFMINQPSLMKAHWMKFSSESADKKFSAQLNASLQRELIFFTIEGMTKAVQQADEELEYKRSRSPTQELVLRGVPEEEEKEEERDSVTFATPSSVPVMNLNYASSEAGSERPSTSSAKPPKNPLSPPPPTSEDGGRKSFLSKLGFSRTNEETDSGLPGLKLPVEALPPPANYVSQQKIKFTPYKAEAFAELRSAYGIKTEAFMNSFEASTKPSISEGASGAFMFFSGDKKFIVKSMAEEEARFLCDIAEDYAEYLIKNPWSFITKFYGCFKITLYEKKFYFVVMENLFDVMEQGVAIHHRYDIKGSWVNRSYKRPRRGTKVKCRHCSMQFKVGGNKLALQCPNVVGIHEPNVVLKDNDLRTRMRIGSEQGKQLYEYLREDSLFLCSLGIMDYSLLMGVTDIEFLVDPPPPQNAESDESVYERRNTVTSAILTPTTSSVGSGDHHKTRADTGSGNSSSFATVESADAPSFGQLDGGRPVLPSILDNGSFQSRSSTAKAMASFSARSLGYSQSSSLSLTGDDSGSGSRSTTRRNTASTEAMPIAPPHDKKAMRKSERVFGPGFYYIGIIDILQQWNTHKKAERFWKVNFQRCDPNGLSAIDPVRYQKRFEAKLREIIAIPKDVRQRMSSLGVDLASSPVQAQRRSTGGHVAGQGNAELVTGRQSLDLAGVTMAPVHDDMDDDEDMLGLEDGSRRHAEPILVRINSQQRRLMSVGGSSRSHNSVTAV